MNDEAARAAAGMQMATRREIGRAGYLSVYELFCSRVRRDPGALAIEEGDRRRSYGELDVRVRRVASLLRQHNVLHGDRIALLSENCGEYLELQLAAARIGAIVACQNWRLVPKELEHCINLVTPKLVVVSPRFAAGLRSIDLGDARVIELGAGYNAIVDALAEDTIRTE
ncbi:MAG: AMP-binding protein, partial [Hyphomicrobium sp.]|nr:AMP-binding protein [Hyphomicrobium sp.]